MKSPIVMNPDIVPETDRDNYTDLQVLKSAAGYYIGTIFQEKDAEGNVTFSEPGSRDSGYFSTEDAARIYLGNLESGLEMPLRERP